MGRGRTGRLSILALILLLLILAATVGCGSAKGFFPTWSQKAKMDRPSTDEKIDASEAVSTGDGTEMQRATRITEKTRVESAKSTLNTIEAKIEAAARMASSERKTSITKHPVAEDGTQTTDIVESGPQPGDVEAVANIDVPLAIETDRDERNESGISPAEGNLVEESSESDPGEGGGWKRLFFIGGGVLMGLGVVLAFVSFKLGVPILAAGGLLFSCAYLGENHGWLLSLAAACALVAIGYSVYRTWRSNRLEPTVGVLVRAAQRLGDTGAEKLEELKDFVSEVSLESGINEVVVKKEVNKAKKVI